MSDEPIIVMYYGHRLEYDPTGGGWYTCQHCGEQSDLPKDLPTPCSSVAD